MQNPPFLLDLPEEEYEERVECDDDLCWVRAGEGRPKDEDIYAIRVILEVPTHGAGAPFTWGVWVTQSKESFLRYIEGVGKDQTGEISFGWFPVSLSFYKRSDPDEPLENLACDVMWQQEGMRPKIVLHESDHPLYLDQRDGISRKRAVEIAGLQMQQLHSGR
jgi:hypothetical protein